MSAGILFEQPQRGDVWRLEVTEYEGRTFGNLRKWYRDREGTLKPSREGVTIPLERLRELEAALVAYHASDPPGGHPSA